MATTIEIGKPKNLNDTDHCFQMGQAFMIITEGKGYKLWVLGYSYHVNRRNPEYYYTLTDMVTGEVLTHPMPMDTKPTGASYVHLDILAAGAIENLKPVNITITIEIK